MRARPNSTRLLRPLAVAVLAAWLVLPGSAGAAGPLHVEVNGELVTVRAEAVSIRTLLEELTRHSKLQVVMEAPLEESVTVTCEQQSMPDVIRAILRHRNYALQYAQPDATPDKSGGSRPNVLWVYSGSTLDGAGDDVAVYEPQTVTPHAVAPDPQEVAGHGPAGADVVKRRQAVLTLADSGSKGEQAMVALAVALVDADAGVREEAVDALADIGGPAALGLLESALRDPDRAVRETAIEAIAGIGGDEAASALTPLLNDADAGLRTDAVDALGEIGGDTATELLQRALADEQAEIREVAAGYLATLSRRGL